MLQLHLAIFEAQAGLDVYTSKEEKTEKSTNGTFIAFSLATTVKNRALNVSHFIYALSFCLPKQSGQGCACPEGCLSTIIAMLAGYAPNCFRPLFLPFKHEFHDLDL